MMVALHVVGAAAMLIGVVGMAAAQAAAQSQPQPEPTWKWPESRVFEVVNRVRAGADLTPKRWPNGGRVAVGLSFDVDNETVSLRDGQTSPALLAQGEYGARAGLPRILDLLDRYDEEGTMLILTMHPHVIGHCSRVGMLERLIQYMRSRPGVWFATHEEIARFVKSKEQEIAK